MQYVVLYFRHDMRDIIPFSEAVEQIRVLLMETECGEYLEDDMAVDGGDAEAILRGPDAKVLYNTILPILTELPFMAGATVTFIYGPQPDSLRKTFELTSVSQ